MADIPDQRPLDFIFWSQLACEELSQYNIGNASNEDEWQEWATSVVHNPELESQGLPDPRLFDSWRDWATQFMLALA